MKKPSIAFIKRLLEDEIEREIIQDSENVEEIEYVNDLVETAKDFIKNYGEWFDGFYLEEKLDELYKRGEENE
jgi:hypothetical protein